MPAKLIASDIANEASGPRPSLRPHFSDVEAACSVVFARILPTPALGPSEAGSAEGLLGSAFGGAESCAQTPPRRRKARKAITAKRLERRRRGMRFTADRHSPAASRPVAELCG